MKSSSGARGTDETIISAPVGKDRSSWPHSGYLTIMRREKQDMNDQAYMISLAMDAFRICIGMKPKTHPAERVLAWMRVVLEAKP